MKDEEAIKQLKQMISLNQFIIINQPTDVRGNKDLNNEIKAMNYILNLIEKQQAEIEKKDKIIKQYEKECRMFKAFCRRVRRDEKHDVDEFNQGQEHRCNQFLNLLEGEKNWSYEGKYFNETDKEIENLSKGE